MTADGPCFRRSEGATDVPVPASAERDAVESVVVRLRIAVLHIDKYVWCDMCGVPCAVTVTYANERDERTPLAVHRLTWCETCEGR
ncbi:hypothetical protein [Saccharopolyspora pogona]|uniref:hypothetical protein n=1 Tax=Saccharopolyspora pogona TaxID=333966 RepID=UPI00168268D6|nr:hypothetical protein [Saccharopolyspora pogona]